MRRYSVTHISDQRNDVYRRVIPTSLQFFRVQRCGNSNPAAHGPCHLNKSVIVGGQRDGQTIDVSGGWHDAGDYIKFLGQTSASTWFLLSAYAHAPDRFSGFWMQMEYRMFWMNPALRFAG